MSIARQTRKFPFISAALPELGRIWYNREALRGENALDEEVYELLEVLLMDSTASTVDTSAEVSQILHGLAGLPPEKVAEVHDFVHFLRSRYATDMPAENGGLASFEREVAAFEVLSSELQERYAGRAVAIYQGQIVADGDSKLAVLETVLANHGYVPCYVDWVKPREPRRARVPSVWIAS